MRMILSPTHRAPLPFVIGAAMLLMCAVLALGLSVQQRTADGWVRHTLEVENRVNHMQMLAARGEIYRRGYLLTGDPGNITAYDRLRGTLLPDLPSIPRLVADNPPQMRRAAALAAAVHTKLDEQQQSIALFRAGRHVEAVAVLESEASRATADRLVHLADRIRGNEAELLNLRRARADRLRLLTETSFVLCALVVFGLSLLVARERRRRLVALAAANRALEEDIVQRKALEQDLDAARLRAEVARNAKSAFLADMSHEIRTPMNGVLGFAELLLASELSGEQRRHAELIADSGRAMMRLLNDILDLSKIEAGQMRVLSEPFDLPHTLGACGKLMAPAIRQRGLGFDCDIPDELPRVVLGDGLRLRQIVLNLLANAAKFTSEGGVALRARIAAGGTWIEIEVEDSGIGIAPDRQAAVFDQFVQADDGIAPRFGGTGLGLAISAQLAHAMGGELRLESELGRGSRFTLVVPLRQPQPAAEGDAAPVADPLAPEPQHETARPSLRVLVAEDHDVNQMLIRAMLDRLGHRVDVAADGGEAAGLAIAADAGDDPYALVLMDLQMPEVDGYDSARRIRAAGIDARRLPILALTANAYADDIAACLHAGMQAHLAKPLNGAALDAAIARWTSVPAQRVAAPRSAERFSPQLRERYAMRRQELIDAVAALAEGKRVTDGEVTEMSRMLHKFLGSAEMFGDAALAREARALEQGFAVWSRARRIDEVRRAADAMRRAA